MCANTEYLLVVLLAAGDDEEEDDEFAKQLRSELEKTKSSH
jgi:hypothetical protein